MKLVAPLFFIALSGQLFAQQQFDFNAGMEKAKLDKAISLKKMGRGTAIAGIGLVGLGIIVGSNSSETTTSTTGGPTQTSSTGNLGLAQASFLLGLGCLGVGIPQWCVGAHREKKLRSQGVTLSLTPQVNGFTLRCRF